MLAHVLESAGLATVGLSLVREQAERAKAPRVLHCPFPLGRPLGRPGDAPFQTDVLRHAFALLERTDGPVLVDYPEVIDDADGVPLACTIPPSFDAGLSDAVNEVRGLRPAYERQVAAAGRSSVGRLAAAGDMEVIVETFVRLATGASMAEVGWDDASLIASSHAVRAYFEEAALALVDHVPEARSVDSWFFTMTATGTALLGARDALKADGVSPRVWGFLAPRAP